MCRLDGRIRLMIGDAAMRKTLGAAPAKRNANAARASN